VTHAGVGTILCARRAGHTPVVVPRLRRYGEHVDDHQAELTRALESQGAVIAVWEMENLAAAVRSVPPRRPAEEARTGPVHSAVRRALLASV
jgi:UDP-N-acetylglucosamine transferase subunit ALG13